MHFSGNTTSLGLVLLVATSAYALPEMESQGATVIKCRLRESNQNQYGQSNSNSSSSPGQIASKQYGMPQGSYTNCGGDSCDAVHENEFSATPCSTSGQTSSVQTKTPEPSAYMPTSSQSVETPYSTSSVPPSSLITSRVSSNTPQITTTVPPSPYEPPMPPPSPPTPPPPTPHKPPHNPPHKPKNPPPPPKEPPTKPPSHPAPSPHPMPSPKQPPSPPPPEPQSPASAPQPQSPTKAPAPTPQPQSPTKVPAPYPLPPNISKRPNVRNEPQPPPPIAEEPPMDNGSSCCASPLVFDVNYDWRVQVKFGTGIWLDPSNVTELHAGADGGDVMLAMPNMNGNGQIDIEEVFGNRTLSPFTNVSYKAVNGFEALHKLAIEADAQPLCIEKSANPKDKSVMVSLPKLKACLQLYGHDLGFISGDNVKVLQPLNEVDTVDVVDYVETPDDCKGGIKHGQKGHYYDKAGHEWRVDDVWFMTGTPYSKGLI